MENFMFNVTEIDMFQNKAALMVGIPGFSLFDNIMETNEFYGGQKLFIFIMIVILATIIITILLNFSMTKDNKKKKKIYSLIKNL